jgi:hypothetical protein
MRGRCTKQAKARRDQTKAEARSGWHRWPLHAKHTVDDDTHVSTHTSVTVQRNEAGTVLIRCDECIAILLRHLTKDEVKDQTPKDGGLTNAQQIHEARHRRSASASHLMPVCCLGSGWRAWRVRPLSAPHASQTFCHTQRQPVSTRNACLLPLPAFTATRDACIHCHCNCQ